MFRWDARDKDSCPHASRLMRLTRMKGRGPGEPQTGTPEERLSGWADSIFLKEHERLQIRVGITRDDGVEAHAIGPMLGPIGREQAYQAAHILLRAAEDNELAFVFT